MADNPWWWLAVIIAAIAASWLVFASLAGVERTKLEQRRRRARTAEELSILQVDSKAVILLLSCLSDKQKKQFLENKSFDVVGSDTGKTYTLYGYNSYNIFEGGNNYCFRPAPRGYYFSNWDIMLAQKIALECDETEALRVANKRVLLKNEVR